MFTSDCASITEIVRELKRCGCCVRCTLRYLGVMDMYSFKGDTEEVTKILEQSQNIGKEEKTVLPEKIVSPVKDQAHEAKNDMPESIVEMTEVDRDNMTDVSKDKEDKVCYCGTDGIDKIAEQNNDKTEIVTQSLDDKILKNGIADRNESEITFERNVGEVCNNNGSVGQGNRTTTVFSSTLRGSSNTLCTVCLGILQEFASEEFLLQVKQHVQSEDFHFSTYLCSLMIPVCIILREHAMLLYLKEKFKDVYTDKKYSDIAAIKDVWKWRNGPRLRYILGAPFNIKSPFEITLTFEYNNSNKECSFLLSSSDNDMFRKRKQDRRHYRKSAFSLYTRANVTKAVDNISDEEFKRSYQCPPVPPTCDTVCDIKCQNENVFVAGRYNKYSRTLSQTPWLIEGVRKSTSSVEELLSTEINKHFKPAEQRFSSSGREDVDVLMLGNGRPFVLELLNPRRREFTQEEMSQIQKTINAATNEIFCRDLQIVNKEDVDSLKEGEIDKVKQYRALCWSKQPLQEEHLQKLSEIKELRILQKTPVRVLHRRPLATRDRIIHSVSPTKLDEHHFSVDMCTQAGTYIKEFVHGDFGRTYPNMSTILDMECDILELDVLAIELEWPKKIAT